MGGVLQIDAAGYVAASRTIGTVAAIARSAVDGLTSTLSGCAAMAGSDPSGVAWASEYDSVAESVLAATQDAVNAGCRLAALLEQTGFNYNLAESASSGAPAGIDGLSYDAVPYRVSSPPRAAGHNAPSLPGGWSLVESAVGRVWPNGHQDRLRSAADAWHSAACMLYDASHDVSDAVFAIAQQVAPEVDDAIAVCNSLRDCLESLADVYKALSTACDEYAASLDHAHSQAEHELVSLLEWTAGIEGAGLFGALFTFGGSELAAQAAETTRIAATAARIAALLDRFGELVRSAAESLTVLSVRAAEVTASLNPLLDLRRVVAITDTVAAARSEKTAAIVLDRVARDASIDLSQVPVQARAQVLDAIQRARAGRVRFPRNDGKAFVDRKGELPRGVDYTEWTAASSGSRRGADRIIVAGEQANPTAIYYWDHVTAPIRIGP